MAKPEKVAERAFYRWVEHTLGGICVKLSMMGFYGQAGFNDRLTLLHGPVTIFVEFKKAGKKAQKLQKYRHQHLKKMGFACYVVRTLKRAQKIVRKEIRAQTLPSKGNRIWRKPAMRRLLLSAGSRKNNDHPHDLSHLAAHRRRRRAVGNSGKDNHL